MTEHLSPIAGHDGDKRFFLPVCLSVCLSGGIRDDKALLFRYQQQVKSRYKFSPQPCFLRFAAQIANKKPTQDSIQTSINQGMRAA